MADARRSSTLSDGKQAHPASLGSVASSQSPGAHKTSSQPTYSAKSSSSIATDELRVEDLSDEELVQAVADLKVRLKRIRIENEVFILFLARNGEINEDTLRAACDKVLERSMRFYRAPAAGGRFTASATSSQFGSVGPARGEAMAAIAEALDVATGARAAKDAATAIVVSAVAAATAVATAAPPPAGSVAVSPGAEAGRGSVRTGGLPTPDSPQGHADSIIPSSSSLTSGSPLMGSVRYSTIDTGPRMNIPGKGEIILKEIEDANGELQGIQKQAMHRIAMVRCQVETAKTCLAEVQDALAALERDLLEPAAQDPVAGRVTAEKLLGHINTWLRNANQLMEKMRLRGSTMRAHLKRVCAQLAQKEELGETLSPVDFEQLAIENSRLLQVIEQKNLQVIELKRMAAATARTAAYAGACALHLSQSKKELVGHIGLETILSKAEQDRERIRDQFEEEAEVVMEQVEKADGKLAALRTLAENYQAPDVLDYVRKKAEVAELRRELRIWDRKMNLQRTAMRVAKEHLRSLAPKQPKAAPEEETRSHSSGFSQFWYRQVPEIDASSRSSASGLGEAGGVHPTPSSSRSNL